MFGALVAAIGGTAAYRRATAAVRATLEEAQTSGAYAAEEAELGWGDVSPTASKVHTPDGAELATWVAGQGPTVVLPHCWGCSHEIWVPVARRLVESGHRVVLYDQRGHAASTRGTATLSMQVLGDDLANVLEANDVTDAVLAGHSIGGMTVMSLATYRPEVLGQRAKAIVLVSTAATSLTSGPEQAARAAGALIRSPITTRAMSSVHGRRFVRGVFGKDPVGAQMDLTRNLFGQCVPSVRAGFFDALVALNLLEGIATIPLPTTVVVGSLDSLTPPRLSDQLVSGIPGARLVTVEGRGHMLPLEDPAAVTDEILRAVKG